MAVGGGVFRQLFPVTKCPKLIGMVHVRALPGTPTYAGSLSDVIDKAVEETTALAGYQGIDGIIVENMHDAPYVKNDQIGPEVVAAMTVVATRVRASFPSNKPVGVQILAGANKEAVAVAHAAGCQFVRAENFVFSHVADEGLMATASAGPLLRFRRNIGAQAYIYLLHLPSMLFIMQQDIIQNTSAGIRLDAQKIYLLE